MTTVGSVRTGGIKPLHSLDADRDTGAAPWDAPVSDVPELHGDPVFCEALFAISGRFNRDALDVFHEGLGLWSGVKNNARTLNGFEGPVAVR